MTTCFTFNRFSAIRVHYLQLTILITHEQFLVQWLMPQISPSRVSPTIPKVLQHQPRCMTCGSFSIPHKGVLLTSHAYLIYLVRKLVITNDTIVEECTRTGDDRRIEGGDDLTAGMKKRNGDEIHGLLAANRILTLMCLLEYSSLCPPSPCRRGSSGLS